MAREPEAEDAAEHRPLPSVDLALLPDELRAVRARTTLVLSVVSMVALGVVGVIFGPGLWARIESTESPDVEDGQWPSGAPSETKPPPAVGALAANTDRQEGPPVAPADPAAVVAPPEGVEAPGTEAAPVLEPATTTTTSGDGRKTVRRFGQAKGFRDALQRAGASPEEAAELITALEDLVDFRKCQPGHELAFERAQDDRLLAFEYRISVTEIYRAERAKNGKLVGSRVEVPVQRTRLAKGGQVAGSLGEALVSLGLGRGLAGVFVEAFEGKADFRKHTRAGDRFKMIVDEEYVGGQMLGYGAAHALEYVGARTGTLQAFWFEAKHGKGDYYDASGRAMHGGWLRTPLRYDHISSGYNLRRRHPVLKRIVPHQGIDYAAAPGTTVWAAADGVVSFAGTKGANGNLISLRHAGGYETFYAHLMRIGRGIKRGVEVRQRQPIGAVGSTGRSTGPHLHFALKRRGRFLNPKKQLNGPGKPLPAAAMPRFKRHMKQLRAELARINLAPAPDATEPQPDPLPTEVFDETEI